MEFIGLFIILAIVLFAPFCIKKVEEELEIFLFIAGCLAVTVTSQWHIALVREALIEPIKITLAVFIAGYLFNLIQKPIAHNVNRIAELLGVKFFAFLLIVVLGFLSSVITAIIAAILLVEIISHLHLNRKKEILLVIFACFSIGLGAALTPIGEPLSTIAISKLKGAPYNAGFFFLFQQLWFFIVPGIILFGLLGVFFIPNKFQKSHGLVARKEEGINDVSVRAVKVYIFIMGLVFLGQGFNPIIEAYISKIPYQGLYWLNIISAVVDNATLTAAEIDPTMGILQIKSALLGLLIAGGMLIPGNIPNIICAGKLKIKSSEWAKFAAPLGLVIMLAYFLVLILA